MDPLIWRGRRFRFDLSIRPLVMGIVNVTPDSFSDGGKFFDAKKAIEHALQLVAEGADLLDIGGESTRPGAEPVGIEEELRRVVPVITELAKQISIPISIDTMKPVVARAALAAGAAIVNDVAGFRDPVMIEVAKEFECGIVVMHMKGDPRTMQLEPMAANAVEEIGEFFDERISTLTAAGLNRDSLCLDPGIGFGKTLEQTLQQLKRLGEYQPFQLPICLGVSRKGFIGQITGRARPDRLAGSLAIACFAVAQGAAQILRVHDVAATRDAVKLWEAINV